jgi:hypothetical protein
VEGKMITIADGEWIADLGARTCRNISNNIVVVFEKSGKILNGKIEDIPMALLSKWAALPNGENKIKNVIMEAEEVFLRAFYESDIERSMITKLAARKIPPVIVAVRPDKISIILFIVPGSLIITPR